MAVQVYRYRRVSTPVQRQQTRWVVLGVALGAGGYVVVFLVTVVMAAAFSLSPLTSYVAYDAGTLLSLLIPLGIGIAVLGHRLFDIDVIIRRTLVYGSLSVILAAVYFGVVLALQALVTALTRQTNPRPIVIVASTLLIATLADPLRRWVQAVIGRRFYRAKYDAARTLQAFAAALRTETDLSELRGQLLAIVRQTMRPASVSLWLRTSSKAPLGEHPVGSD